MAKPVNQAQMINFQMIPSYNSDEVLRSSVYGLFFQQIDDVVPAWTELETKIGILFPTSKLLGYSPPAILSPCGMSPLPWSMTKNASERGNNALNRAFKAAHPSLWTFLTKLRKFHAEVETN